MASLVIRGNLASQWLGTNGNVSAPMYSFSSAPSSGIFHAGSGNVGLSVSGTKIVSASAGGLAVTGNINANYILGNGSFLEGVSLSGNGSLSSNLVPSNNSTYDLGSATSRWRNLYLGGSAINFGSGVTFDSFDWSYLLAYVVPPSDLENQAARVLFSGSPDGHAGYVAGNKAYMFGRNHVGQLGLGDVIDRATPTLVATITDAVGIACGADFTCVITSGGTAWAWGRNANGQLGDGTTTDRSLPVAVNGISTAIGVAAGQGHVLYLLANGTVVGYGNDTNGQLGNGTAASNSVNSTLTYVAMPSATSQTFVVTVANDVFVVDGVNKPTLTLVRGGVYTFVQSASTNAGHPIAFKDGDGNAYTTGVVSTGTPGSAGAQTVFTVANDAPTNLRYYCTVHGNAMGNTITLTTTKARFIACGAYHSLMLLENGSCYTFGDNAYNQLGVTLAISSSTPVIVPGVSNVVSAACGEFHTLLARYDGQVLSCGRNQSGQCGVGNTATVTAFTSIVAGTEFSSKGLSISLGGGTSHSIIARDDGTVQVFGSNATGQLGLGGSVASVTTPTTLVGYSAYRVACGKDFSFLLLRNSAIHTNAIVAFGNNVYGNMGDSQPNVQVRWIPNRIYDDATRRALVTSTNDSSSMGYVEIDGVAYVCGTNTQGQLGNGSLANVVTSIPVSSITPRIASISVGAGHMIAIDGIGELWASGLNSSSQLGDGTIINRTRPVRLAAASPSLTGKVFVRVACGFSFSAAIDSTGVLYTWGFGTSNQIGDGAALTRTTPIALSGGAIVGKSFVSVQCGQQHSVALDSLGAVYAWGQNQVNQLGTGDVSARTVPTLISGGGLTGTIVVAIACGQNHSAALSRDGKVYMWGFNAFGQIGDATTTNRSLPFAILGGSALNQTFTAISCGGAHTLAIDSIGRIHAWGMNSSGQLGDSTVTQRTSPILVTGGTLSGKSVVAITGFATHTAALASDGSIHTWGNNAGGKLGDGTETNRLVPGLVSGTSRDSFVRRVSEGYSGTHKLLMNRVDDNKKILTVVGTNTYSQLGDGTVVDKFYVTKLPAFTFDVVYASNSKEHSAIILSNGTVYLWGRNSVGQCGPLNAGVGNAGVPTLLAGIGNASQVQCGDGFTLILLQDGTVRALGSNTAGKLGNVSVTTYTTTPVSVTGVSGVTQIACGPDFALACTTSGALWTWGSNVTGSTGLGTTTGSTTLPTQVSANIVNVNGDKVVGVSAGESHAVIRIRDTSNRIKVFSAGSNLYGQLGRSASVFTSNAVSSFGVVAMGTTATPLQIACGQFHTVVYTSNLRAYTFGRNNATQLGVAGADRSTPYLLPDIDVTGIASGTLNTYLEIASLIVAYGTYYATIHHRVLANGIQEEGFNSGKKGGGSSATRHNAIVTLTGQLGMFGNNGASRLGDGTTTNRLQPIWTSQFGSLIGKRVVAVACGSAYTLAVDNLGKIHGFGTGSSGQLGFGGSVNQTTPVECVAGSLAGKFIIAVGAGSTNSCALDTLGGVHSFGLLATSGAGGFDTTQASVLLNTTGTHAMNGKFIVAISQGFQHAMAIDSTGKVYAWGELSYSRTGSNAVTTATQHASPVALAPTIWSTKVIVAISCGFYNGLAIDSNGVVYGWGYNEVGQVGNNTLSPQTIPIAITGGSLAGKIAVAVSCGYTHSMALASDGTVHVWGDGTNGQLGDGTAVSKSLPQVVSQLSTFNKFVVSISAGQFSSYATTSIGEVYAWGDNSSGQLGDGTTTARSEPTLTSTAALYSNFNQGTGTTPVFINFTGQHRVYVAGHAPRDLPRLEGLVVSATSEYMTPTRQGHAAITINESLPIVSLSATPNDKRAFGVISLSYNESPLAAEQEYQLSQLGDVRVHINSVGEGAMWVCDANGPLESGDLITTSHVEGYGMRQNDDIMRNYTVAKITMSCDFSAPLVGVQELEKDAYGQTVLDADGLPVWIAVMESDGEMKLEAAYTTRYLEPDGTRISKEEYDMRVADGLDAVRAAFVGCTYHCG